ncbi:hypothetical protein GGI22_003170 [Coemansia erecta]|nr:hypothetical protein GGI22_003170 [Coemansia erecta]
MSVNKLPVDVLYRIMKLACAFMRGFSISHKSMLPLVHCCRYWRMVGTPIAYQSLEVIDRRDDTVKSNAQLIANVNDTTVAKTAILKFERCMDIAQVMHAVCDNLVANNERNWKTIHTLYIHLNLTNIAYTEGVAPYDVMLDKLYRYIDQFRLLVPNVKVLNIRSMAIREFDPLYAGKLVALYSKQLTSLESVATISTKEPLLYMPFVRHLDIHWLPGKQPCAIQVDATLVTEASLCLVPSSFSWESMFAIGSTMH